MVFEITFLTNTIAQTYLALHYLVRLLGFLIFLAAAIIVVKAVAGGGGLLPATARVPPPPPPAVCYSIQMYKTDGFKTK